MKSNSLHPIHITSLISSPMTQELVTTFAPNHSFSLDRNPAAVYLAMLRPTGRRTMHQVLNVMAGWLSNDRQDALSFDWSTLRYQHTAAIAACCAENYKSTTANKMLAALRQVLKEAWQLGLIDGETYHRATALPPVRGQSLPAGRALPTDE